MTTYEAREDELFTCICGDNKRVMVDVSSLTEYSRYFGALMQSQMVETRERTLDFQLFTSDILQLVLKLFHLKDTPFCVHEDLEITKKLDLETVEDVLKVVDYLDLPCLYASCSRLLNTMVEPQCYQIESLQKICAICHRYGLVFTKELICKKLAACVSKVVKNDPLFFYKVPEEVLAEVLATPEIDLSSEVEVLQYVVDWIHFSKEERMKHFRTLFKCVHIPSLAHSDLIEVNSLLHSVDDVSTDIMDLYLSYKKNPSRYFLKHPEHCAVRNGCEVLLMVGGTCKQLQQEHNLQFGHQHCRFTSLIMYQEIEQVCHTVIKQTPKQVPQKSQACKVNRTTDNKFCLCCRTVPRLKSPRLVEFGVSVHEKFVYLAGGQSRPDEGAKFAAKVAFRMDPHTGDWTEISPMKEARCLFYLGSIWGRLYAVGGANQLGVLRGTEYYVPEDDLWYKGPELVTELHEHAGCVFENKLYISGGHTDTEHTDQVWVLESLQSGWTRVAPLRQSRSYHAMAVVADSIYVVGGCVTTESKITDVYGIEQYNSVADFWTCVLTLNQPISCCLPVTIDNQIVFVGGYSFSQNDYLQQAVCIDISKKTWKISPIKTNTQKRVVGYSCLKLIMNRRIFN